MGGRKSPFKRGKNHFILQERDKEILSVLYEYRFLTNDQLSALFNFGCLTRINSRLRKLYDNQFLCRHYLSHPSGQAKILHFPGPESVGVISEKLGIDPAIVRKKRKKIPQTATNQSPGFFTIRYKIVQGILHEHVIR